MVQPLDYAAQFAAWREKRLARLTAEDGWLNLVGLWWLDEGPLSVGSGAAREAVLPSGPDLIGTARLEAGDLVFDPADMAAQAVRFRIEKTPTRFPAGDFLVEAVQLAGRPALRIRDLSATAGAIAIDSYPVDPAWRIVADWLPLAEPIHTTVDTVIGAPTAVTITHKAVFRHAGETVELLPTHGTAEAPQFVIRDRTSGRTTYTACRFLFGEEIAATGIVLDFNKAINPPCAFSSFAICPLPPPQNVLPFAVEAGEKTWHS